mgnify:CR=1 FL=1
MTPATSSPCADSLTLDSAPLLVGEGLPVFGAITPEQVVRCVPDLLEHLEAEFVALEGRLEAALGEMRALGWHEVLDPLQRLEERLSWSWGVVSHLHGVCDSPELREAHASQQARVVAFGNRCGQSTVLHGALLNLQQQGGLDATQKRIVSSELRHMELRGVALKGEERDAFNATSQELAKLSTDFGNRVLDATNGWTLLLREPAEVEGLPVSLRELLAQAARAARTIGAASKLRRSMRNSLPQQSASSMRHAGSSRLEMKQSCASVGRHAARRSRCRRLDDPGRLG